MVNKVNRIPPQNLDAEKAILGSIMVRKNALYEIEDLLVSESFYAHKHSVIFEAMKELSKAGEPIDLLSVSTKLENMKTLADVGGRAYIAELAGEIPASANVRYYAELIQRNAILRGLIDTGEYIAELGFSENTDTIWDTLEKVETKVFSSLKAPQSLKFISIKDTLSDAWERIERLHEDKGALRGVPTGFRDLDNILAGLQNSDLIILAARPSVGKTTLALDIARRVALDHNKGVGIFSLEMSSDQLVDRMLAAESRVNAWKLRTGKLDKQEDFQKIQKTLDKLSKAPIYIDDTPGNSIARMRSVARRLALEKGLGLIVIDYLQLMTTAQRHDSMVNQVTEISRSLKGLARELNVPVLALSQLSRAVEARGGKPRLSDLRDSGSIEQDADVVMFIHREDRYKEKEEKTFIAEIMIEKHRNGPIGQIELFFDEKKGTFVDIDHSNMDDAFAGFSSPTDADVPMEIPDDFDSF